MRIHQIDPTRDGRWAELVGRHPQASIFHTVAWLQTLRQTYGYEPIALTTSPPTAELKNGLVFCRVRSWLTGNRLISLPFSDHCEPLCDSAEDLNFILRYLQTTLGHQHWKRLEVRPVSWSLGQADGANGFRPADTYLLHVLDLCPKADDLFRSFHKDSVQRRIHRAERAGLVEKVGRSDDLLKEFYRLFVVTRRRHRLPPIPYSWFRNLIQYHGDALEIRLAYRENTATSAILTLRFKNTVYYKYGCADSRFNKFGGMPWLLWRAIVASKSFGAIKFDMGRTEEHNVGLVAFKNHWVAQPQRIVYWTFPGNSSLGSVDGWQLKAAKRVFSCMPNRLLTLTGRLIYRHIA